MNCLRTSTQGIKYSLLLIFIGISQVLFPAIVAADRGEPPTPSVCDFELGELLFEAEWEKPTGPGGPIIRPFLLADKEGTLHLFWSLVRRDGTKDYISMDIFYMQKRDGERWSPPVNILISPDGEVAHYVQAVVDDEGIIHVVWNGDGVVYYSHASVDDALNAHGWISSRSLPTDGYVLPPVALGIDSAQTLHLIFPIRGDDLYYLVSSDRGDSWSPANPLNLLSDWRTATDTPRLWVDHQDTLNLVWMEVELPDGYPPTGVFFSRSTDGGNNWSRSVRLAGHGDGQGNVIVAEDGHVYVVYRGRVSVGGTFARMSRDGGFNWEQPVEIVPRGEGGLTGTPGLSLDAKGYVHMISGDDLETYYSVGVGNLWTPVVDLRDMLPTPATSYSEEPTIAVTLGNKVHTVFYDGSKRLWYVSCDLPVGGSALEEYTQDDESTPPILILPTSVPRQQPELVALPLDQKARQDLHMGWSVGAAILVPLLFVIIVTVFHVRVREI